MTLADDFTSFSGSFDYYVTLYVSTVELEGHLRCFGTVSEMLLNMVMFSLCVVIVTKITISGPMYECIFLFVGAARGW